MCLWYMSSLAGVTSSNMMSTVESTRYDRTHTWYEDGP